ncbi:3'-5' RNA helicase YTHDC2 [Dunckerocampus dactyliophorus]|uniref:3'-5' RNA helicase YTHDC2 n=1 Tax=Dunckerocampus dactyliophorus TaxID=161453 RepID=UPI0024055FA5|nr:3'-5' RNA helicase YTHDC2 [Dunckerocampus dactyliophorus]XP_054613382.1 3'-5' RNA helicase YTHDC2 [Dunckerocampus dactyliophorus]XP_054613383.1 3'-5' RNA helicase YTHDC2 [Dunckerocampus dactyliophorus]
MPNSRAASQTPGKMREKPQKSSITSRFKEIHISEEVKISINLALERFRFSEQKEMEFPSSLTSTERAFIHRTAQTLGYISKSKGKGPHRFLTIRKKNNLDGRRSTMPLTLSQNSLHAICSLLQRFPLTSKMCEELQASNKSKLAAQSDNCADTSRPNCLISSVSVVPPRRRPSEFDIFRRSLPVCEHEEEIVRLVRENRVVLVLGETGSGKTTQIPQFLLDDCSKKGEPCRIFCTQPRRLAAITVAERVAAEMGEAVGHTVGYQIRLQSRVSPKTLLTFCTIGVFLRTLMAGNIHMTTVTHVIVDEVHERDGLTDFLLTKMLDVLQEIPTLKLILSSASLDVDLFLKYFGAWSCPVVHLKGRQFEVKQLFLEDILRLTDFNKEMEKCKEDSHRKDDKQNLLTKWCKVVEKSGVEEVQNTHVVSSGLLGSSNVLDSEEGDGTINTLNVNGSEQLEPWLLREMDACISNIFINDDQEAFIQLFHLILTENVNVDYMHSETGATPLMVAAGRGFLTEMEQLLSMGADVNLKASNGWTALDFAQHFQQAEAVDLLQSSIPLGAMHSRDELALVQCATAELRTEDQEVLTLYHGNFDDEFVDLDLIMDLLYKICSTMSDGAVLIFLPGYNEIVSLRDRILYDDKRFQGFSQRYQVFTLHSDMPSTEQKKAMKTSPPGIRKIILSTNIAETSITINDVVFVIDSGKVKEKSFDTVSRVSMLKTVWISKASALQRKGRAGRCQPGICFHLFSQLRFRNMQEFQVPQLLRMPLQELCLQTKLLTPCPIMEFLSKAPQPPLLHAVKSAVQMLKTIDALNPNEDLTDLGFHLADLPVEPHLGKMVLCAVVLKCLDPVLTIACTLGYRDPFVLPAQGSQKRAALQCRKRFSSNTFSDHMALLRAFQAWQKARNDGWERAFCEKNFLSQATMDMILGMRTQLMGQLRAIGFVRAHGDGDIRNVNINSENWAVVKAALVAGMYPNLVHINQETKLPCSNKEKKVHFHPTSILSHPQQKGDISSKSSQTLPTDWLVYDEMSRGHRIASVRCCSLVTPITVAIFGGSSRPLTFTRHEASVQKDSPACDMSDSDTEDSAEMKIDDWLIFQMDNELAEWVFDLRHKWHHLFIKRIGGLSKPWSQQDEMAIQTLVSVLTIEEKGAGLEQPTGIGQRPRPALSEEGIQNSIKNCKGSPKLPCMATDDRAPEVSVLCQKKPQNKDKTSLPRNPLTDELPSSSSSSSFHCSNPAFASVRYFIMKSSNMRNIEISQQKGIWSTLPSNESNLIQAFHENEVILIFSVQGSGHFQGYARMSSIISHTNCQDWGLTGLGGVFSVEWLCKKSLPFRCTQHILNPLTDYKKVQISRDGQELDAQAGRQLLSLWERNTSSHS